MVACGEARGSSDADEGPAVDPIRDGQGVLVVTTTGLPAGLVPSIMALRRNSADSELAECVPARST